MKTKLATTLLALAVASSATHSFANNSFNGVYAGANIGAFTSSIGDKSDGIISQNYSSDANYAPSVVIGYGTSVYKSIYLGIAATISNGGTKSVQTISDNSGVLAKYSSKATRSHLIGLNIGYTISDNIMLYGKYGKGATAYQSSVDVCSGVCSGSNVNRDMQSVGLGLMYKIDDKILATAEVAKNTPTQTTAGQDVSEQVMSVGLAYKF